MMFMPDAVRGAIEVMEADPARLLHRNAFNVTAMQLAPEDLAGAIRVHLPAFGIDFDIDPVRQAIAESWPRRIDDSAARAEWAWQPRHDVAAMTAEMLTRLRDRRPAPLR
jgi:nucleoside-diphosphate-sugar epimerase